LSKIALFTFCSLVFLLRGFVIRRLSNAGRPHISVRISSRHIFRPNCRGDSHRYPPGGTRVLEEFTRRFASKSDQLAKIDRAFTLFASVDSGSRAILAAVEESLIMSVLCSSCRPILPPEVSRSLAEFSTHELPALARRYPGIELRTEVWMWRHGILLLPPAVRRYIKNKSLIDVGGFDGDSALAMAPFGRDVWSFELSPANYQRMLEVLATHADVSGNIRGVNVAVSDYNGVLTLPPGSGTMVEFRNSTTGTAISVTTLDRFGAANNRTVGLLKADTEGHGLQVVRGGMNTLKAHRPAFTLSCYHVPEEMFDMPELLIKELKDYVFFWDMPAQSDAWYHELVFMGYPAEAIQTR
jgi:FkbM family methyltransferase